MSGILLSVQERTGEISSSLYLLIVPVNLSSHLKIHTNIWIARLSKLLLFFPSVQQMHTGERHSVHAGLKKRMQINLLAFPEKKAEKMGANCLVLDVGQIQRTTVSLQ